MEGHHHPDRPEATGAEVEGTRPEYAREDAGVGYREGDRAYPGGQRGAYDVDDQAAREPPSRNQPMGDRPAHARPTKTSQGTGKRNCHAVVPGRPLNACRRRN